MRRVAKRPRAQINYLFFGIYFAIVTVIHVFHVFLIEPEVSFSSYFFSAYALAQCALETLLLVLLAVVVYRFFPRFLNVFALVAFFLFLSHVIDFPLVRLMDMSFWYALNFVSLLNYETFLELLLASNVSILVWILTGIGGIAFLIGGIFLFRLAAHWSSKRQWLVPVSMLMAVSCTLCLFLVSWDFGMRKFVADAHFDRYQKTLPWKTTLFPPKMEYITLTTPLQDLETEEELMRKIDSRAFSLARKPDIYLFIVESLREDFIDEINAPALQQFKEENISFEKAFSNSNATHISWFSLCYSKFPLYWGKVDPEIWKGGSIPLQLLKKMGYKIHVSSSARLGYFEMDRIIFGEGAHLADAIFMPDDEEIEEKPYLRDQKAIDNLLVEMDNGKSGRLFIVFLDATHFDYSWPPEMTRFHPIKEKINYFKAAVSQRGLPEIINRYRNALSFIDSLFEKFLDALDQSPGGKEAVVVITGDHGEEFYESGNLFHASSLSHQQTHIPLYYRFGEQFKRRPVCNMTCHMDIFPTLFHYIIGEDLMGEVLQGESIFKADRWPYTLIARFSASRSPTEFCIHDGTCKLIAEFTNEKDIFSSKSLKILSTKNCQDENLIKEIDAIHEEFDPALDRIFSEP